MGDQMTRVLQRLAFAGAVLGPLLAAGAAHAVEDTPPGQNVRLPDNDLIEAVRDGDIAAVHRALLAGLSPDDTGIDNVPAIVVAADYGQADIVKYLLANGAHPNYKAKDGRTALSVAAQAGRTDIANILLDGGADPNEVAQNRDTALLIAVRAHRTGVVQALIAHNVDLDDTDVTGRSALDLSREHNFDDITALLEQAENGG